MFRLDRLRFSAALSILVVLLLFSGVLVAGDESLLPGGSFFDDDGNIHEGAIEAIAAVGITKGCNPPDNTMYCPTESVTRGQMAAFLRRALDLPASSVDAFTDDDGSVFEHDINAIAAPGITKGCNPPDNTHYCPFDYVKRDQMASFLTRALGLTPMTPPPYSAFVSPVGAFAEYSDVPLLSETDEYAGPDAPTSLSGVIISDWVAQQLEDPGVAEHLTEYGFVVTSYEYQLFHWVYDTAPYEGHPVFVTTDAAYNLWHLVFDKILRNVETDVLLPELEDLVQGMLVAARAQSAELAATPLADHALRVEEWLEAAATLLELDVGPIGSRAQQEVDLILAHSEVTQSPTMGIDPCQPELTPETCVSYAMFKPRGHYTRSAELQRYFRVMSMLGQTPLPIYKPEEMRLAGLLIGLLVNDSDLRDSWQVIYDPTAFLVGLADDYTPYEFEEVVTEEIATGFSNALAFADVTNLTAIADGLAAMRPIVIDPERPSVRFMGSRATLDAFTIDQLIDPTVPGRMDVSGLDVAAAFGSDWALDIQRPDVEDYPEYLPQLYRLRRAVDRRTPAQWAATVYDAWLHAIAVVWADHGTAYPDFMQGDAWAAKAHQTGLGSYAELKHDTILYVKPAFAEGDGPPEPEIPPRHWVEPEPVAFARLSSAATLMGDGLTARGLLSTEHEALIDETVEICDRLARIAEDELDGLSISAADNDWLREIGPTLEYMWLSTADIRDTGEPSNIDEQAAIVADIATTLLGAREVATGSINPILVLVPNDSGQFQVAVGGVYSYYEFWQPASERLTDEEWRAMLAAGTEPGRPEWEDILFAD